jgi:hypothetical protein
MKLRHVLLALSLVTVAFSSVSGVATHEESECTPTASEPTAEAGGVAVFVDEVNSNGYLYSAWIYQESNGLDGIQRQDSYTEAQGLSDETCGHGPDTIVF